MDCDLSWLIGRSCAEVAFLDGVLWRFGFGDAHEILPMCPWRVIHAGGIAVTSEDHGHQFGLPAPFDAEAACRVLIGGAIVRAATVRDESRDIAITFESGARLEVIPLSAGYESWQVVGPGRHIIAVGGGDLSVWFPDG